MIFVLHASHTIKCGRRPCGCTYQATHSRTRRRRCRERAMYMRECMHIYSMYTHACVAGLTSRLTRANRMARQLVIYIHIYILYVWLVEQIHEVVRVVGCRRRAIYIYLPGICSGRCVRGVRVVFLAWVASSVVVVVVVAA